MGFGNPLPYAWRWQDFHTNCPVFAAANPLPMKVALARLIKDQLRLAEFISQFVDCGADLWSAYQLVLQTSFAREIEQHKAQQDC